MTQMATPAPAGLAPLFTPKLVTVLREGYGLAQLRADAMAGLTVAIVALPLSMAIRMQADGGKPTVVADTESQIAMIYQEMARSVGARITQSGLGAQAMPTIEISDD